jgi:hypothetical protein
MIAACAASILRIAAAGQETPTDQSFANIPAFVLLNHAQRSSPRIIEEYPQLARPRIGIGPLGEQMELKLIRQNKAAVQAPRNLERYPQLERASRSTEESVEESPEFAKLLQNAALANSPRMREEFQCLQFSTYPAPGFVAANAYSRHP